jgi:hypothetical protein
METSNARGWDGMPTWRKQKPTRSGVYGVRGFNLGDEPEEQFEAIVAVRLYGDELVCNLHESTSEADFDNWMLVSDISEAFEWCEFAAAPPPAAARGDVRGLVAKWREHAAKFPCSQSGAITAYHTNELESALAADGVQAGEVTQRAEELANMAVTAFISSDLGRWLAALRAIASALSQQPEARGVVDGDLREKYELLRTLLRRDWREVYIGTKKYQLTLTVNPDYMDRINAALTGERNG